MIFAEKELAGEVVVLLASQVVERAIRSGAVACVARDFGKERQRKRRFAAVVEGMKRLIALFYGRVVEMAEIAVGLLHVEDELAQAPRPGLEAFVVTVALKLCSG